MGLGRHLWAVARKDLRVEARSREIVATVGFFAALIVAVMAFAFEHDRRFARTAAPGLLWTALAFGGVLGIGRAFDRERDGDTMRALLLSPAPRLGIFLGKAVTIALMVMGVGVVCVPLVGLFLSVDLFEYPLRLVAAVSLGAIGDADRPLVVAFIEDLTSRHRSEAVIRDYQARLQTMAFDAAVVSVALEHSSLDG